MLKWKTSSIMAASVALLAAVVFLSAGGTALASNTGFKANIPIVLDGAGGVGDNWISIPYFSPYVTVAGLCGQLGLQSTGGPLVAKATVQTLNPLTGVYNSVTCGSATAGTTALTPPAGYLIRQPSNAPLPSVIVVGSHNPNLAVSLLNRFRVSTTDDTSLPLDQCPSVSLIAPSQRGDNWFSLPYHTTALSVADLCASAGLSSTGGPLVVKARVEWLDPSNGLFVGASCGSATAPTTLLSLGRAVKIREPNTGTGSCTNPAFPVKTFIPAHF